MIRVLIYDDVDQLRESLLMMLDETEGFQVVGAYNNCVGVLDHIKLTKPDIILMDIDMPEMNGIDGVKKIRLENTEVKILMLTVFEDNRNVFEAIKAGANGYLLKKNSFEKLIGYIKEAHNGGAPMSASIATQVLQMFSQFSLPSNVAYNLSDREKQVLQLLVDGNSYKMVAAEMKISIDTVRSHIRNIYEKLHVNSKSEAVAKAIKSRIV